ncbi:hypothetical protein L228DRAFT_238237 [Xylona heveae TC161]|uniref:Uncharacterized protein n=1 Tax=Xylona heveae (strain CBS 132557 / TC161) TaxID=1328760 RepID=A0A165HLR6_XYLHT|nr:hypothetical protein L228DRAFT_238237 [Xylona heveae TC161]KZF23708.1 hypothetical protein L228DRAFT_238237 [Xylona heveae TC161]
MDPTARPQPTEAQAYTTAGNPVQHTPAESAAADRTANIHTTKIAHREAGDVASDHPASSALMSGTQQGQKNDNVSIPPGIGLGQDDPIDPLEGEKMHTYGEGEVRAAQDHKTGTGAEKSLTSDLDRKKAEQEPRRHEIQAQRAAGLDIDGALGQRGGPATVQGHN